MEICEVRPTGAV